MSKNRKVTHEEIDARVDQILQHGYYVMELEWFHFRFQDAVDFWPSTFRWQDIKGRGRGLGQAETWLLTAYAANGGK
jgi:hypothetical protein